MQFSLAIIKILIVQRIYFRVSLVYNLKSCQEKALWDFEQSGSRSKRRKTEFQTVETTAGNDSTIFPKKSYQFIDYKGNVKSHDHPLKGYGSKKKQVESRYSTANMNILKLMCIQRVLECLRNGVRVQLFRKPTWREWF